MVNYSGLECFFLSYSKLVLLPVNNDGCDLLVHEEEDGEEHGRDGGKEVDIPGGVVII